LIVVDTTVWIDCFDSRDAPPIEPLVTMIEASARQSPAVGHVHSVMTSGSAAFPPGTRRRGCRPQEVRWWAEPGAAADAAKTEQVGRPQRRQRGEVASRAPVERVPVGVMATPTSAYAKAGRSSDALRRPDPPRSR
jgi:hypothetical protein